MRSNFQFKRELKNHILSFINKLKTIQIKLKILKILKNVQKIKYITNYNNRTI